MLDGIRVPHIDVPQSYIDVWSLLGCNIVICKRSFSYPFCPILCSHPCTFLQHFLWPFFSLLDNFLSFVVQLFLLFTFSNPLIFSCFSFSALSKSFPKRETFLFLPLQKFPVLENFFRMQRYEIITTYKHKTNFFLKKSQKKWFFLSPTLPIAHRTSFSSLYTLLHFPHHVSPSYISLISFHVVSPFCSSHSLREAYCFFSI